MASEPNRATLRHIDRLFQGGTMTGLDEGQLLGRFGSDRDESALEALVDRHGPMVLGVCRRQLANPADVDDAFQATFLILVRKARSLRDSQRLGPWLHGVAYRAAVRARADASRRRDLEQHGSRPESGPEVHAPDRLAEQAELRAVLDQEIEGTFRIRGKPGVHQEIDVNLDRSVLPGSYRFQSYAATTDDPGRFVIDRILDGEADFLWSSGRRGTMARSSASPSVDVRPGQTVRVDLGGPGRPLIGQVVLSASDGSKAGDRVPGINVANARGWLEIKPSQMAIPADFQTWDTQKRQAYKIEWYRTEAGRAYLRTRRFHMFPAGVDGRFRIEDVVPGSYNLSISVQSTPGMTHPLTRNRLGGRIERDREVGAIPCGHSDEPLDLGPISLKLELQK